MHHCPPGEMPLYTLGLQLTIKCNSLKPAPRVPAQGRTPQSSSSSSKIKQLIKRASGGRARDKAELDAYAYAIDDRTKTILSSSPSAQSDRDPSSTRSDPTTHRHQISSTWCSSSSSPPAYRAQAKPSEQAQRADSPQLAQAQAPSESESGSDLDQPPPSYHHIAAPLDLDPSRGMLDDRVARRGREQRARARMHMGTNDSPWASHTGA